MRTGGWVVFAGLMLVMAGLFGAMEGLVAIIQDEVFLGTDDLPSDLAGRSRFSGS